MVTGGGEAWARSPGGLGRPLTVSSHGPPHGGRRFTSASALGRAGCDLQQAFAVISLKHYSAALPAFLMTTLYSSSAILVSIFRVLTLSMSAVSPPRRSPAMFAFHIIPLPRLPYDRDGRTVIRNWLSRGRLCGSGTLREWQRGMMTTKARLDIVWMPTYIYLAILCKQLTPSVRPNFTPRVWRPNDLLFPQGSIGAPPPPSSQLRSRTACQDPARDP